MQSFWDPRGGLLPQIKPIGDIDEDLLGTGLEASPEAPDIPDAISPLGRQLLLMSLIGDWTRDNPQSALAREIAGSPSQSLALAQSLAEFADTLETEEIDGTQISELFGLESAQHREAILGFLALARERLPVLLKPRNLSGPKERQSRIIRHEARRLAQSQPRWPVIAAGSTGTIPATRELLLAIAKLPSGAVVLPGLDLTLDQANWDAAGPQHPQYAMKQLLATFGVARDMVVPLGEATPSSRAWLTTELMRPPEGSDAWQDVVTSQNAMRQQAGKGLTLIEAADRDEEALAIALMLRETHEDPAKTACLITPDRDLSRRVKQALTRWNIAIDDTGGEPLINFSGPALAALLLEAMEAAFSPASLNALLKHPMALFGREPAVSRRAASLVELALLRFGAGVPDLANLQAALTRNRTEIEKASHSHAVFQQFSPEDWIAAQDLLQNVTQALTPLEDNATASLPHHLDEILECLETIAGPQLWSDEAGFAFHKLMSLLRREAAFAGPCDRREAATIIRHCLQNEVFRPSRGQNQRLAIYGLLEARLMRADVHVLGGLNEAIWPALPNSGPWLNRPMRDKLGMQLPERAIGQTAHDFVQAMGAGDVRLVWSRRVGDSPAIPSRWILRLAMLLGGLEPEKAEIPRWLLWSRALSSAALVTPCPKPLPKPPVAARPARLSVTQIETLIRDPYAIHAQVILRLEPLQALNAAPDTRLRGILYHEAIGKFLAECREAYPPNAEERLMAIARNVFAPHFDVPLIAAFWWPRFQRIAQWIAAEDASGIARIYAEVPGALTFAVAGQPFKLTCRADRIDVLTTGEARITDYKSGTVPSAEQVKAGLAPQLTLEAAMLERGAFRDIGKQRNRKPRLCQARRRRTSGGDQEAELEGAGCDSGQP